MSVFERGSASKSDLEIGVPEFPVALRGYDRQQVDAFIQDLTVRLTAERRRAEQSERVVAQMQAEVAGLRDPAPLSFEHLGAEAGRVLEQAGNSAKLLVEEARSRGQAIVAEAEAEAGALIERAEQRAAALEAEASETLAQAAGERERILAEAAQAVDDVRTRAGEEARTALQDAREAAERIREKASAEQMTMQAQTQRLRDSRDQMLDYLGRIHSDLGELLAEAVQADAALTPQATGLVVVEAVENSQFAVDGEEPEVDDAEVEEPRDEESEGEEARPARRIE